MPAPSLPLRVLCLAAAGAVAWESCARAQDTGLRGSIGSTLGFPNSPAVAPVLTPERVTPPTLLSGPQAADETSPSATPPQNEEDSGAPNYGKPRKPRAKLYRPDPKGSPPLPGLVPYRGAPGTRRLLNPRPAPINAVDPIEPGPTVAVIQSPLRARRYPYEPLPFQPLGVRVGELRLLPFVETSTGYESNPNQLGFNIKPSAVLRAAGGLDVRSDFPTNSLTASLRGGYSYFPSNSNASRPDLTGVVNGRVDVTRDDQILSEVRFALSTQTPGSPTLAVPNSVFIVSRPLISSEGATLGGQHTFNRLSVSLRGTIDRTQYGDATQSNGTLFRYSQDNFNDYGVVARANYELTPVLIPFTEVGFDSRVRDNTLDLSGFRRSSIGGTARVGSSFEFFRIFNGSLAAGYGQRHYEDPRLKDLRGPTLDGSLVYAVTPLTTATFRASTTLAETTLAGASGAISRLFSLEVAHVFFTRFTVSGIATYQPNEYQGVAVKEAYTQFTLRGDYAVTRDVHLTASASRQSLKSTFQNLSFNDNIFLLGVRLQR